MQRRRTSHILFAIAVVLSAAGGEAAAQTPSGVVAAEVKAADPTFWTPHRLSNAAPLPLSSPPGLAPTPLAAAPRTPASAAAPEGGAGSPPTVWLAPQPDDLVNAPIDLDQLQAPAAIPDAFFGRGLFTESRVIPPNTGQPAPAVNAYPYSTVGRLFFHDPRTGQDFHCSAAVAAGSPRAILTAGQCVAHGSSVSGQRYFYNNFMFIPAYDNGAAPYGKWSAGRPITSNSWFFTGFLPNPGDFALIEAADQGGKTLGSVVGYLGWQTLRLSFNHFTTLAYPCNLDSCRRMQRNDAQTSGNGGNNTWVQGTDMGSGVQGGPWVQDFGLQPQGAPTVPFGGNVVVGVASYGGSGFIGASQFNSTFVSMRAAFCAHQAGNCPR